MMVVQLKENTRKEYEELHHFILEHSYYDLTQKQRERHNELESLLYE